MSVAAILWPAPIRRSTGLPVIGFLPASSRSPQDLRCQVAASARPGRAGLRPRARILRSSYRWRAAITSWFDCSRQRTWSASGARPRARRQRTPAFAAKRATSIIPESSFTAGDPVTGPALSRVKQHTTVREENNHGQRYHVAEARSVGAGGKVKE